MYKWLLHRTMSLLPVLLLLVLVTSAMLDFIPGDPADLLLGDFATEEEKTSLRDQLQLNLPFWQRQTLYIQNMLKGDLGYSLMLNEPVSQLIIERIPATVELAIISILLAILMSLPLGLIAAVHSQKWPDHLSRLIAMLGVSIPNFWLGPMLILVFSLYLGWFPVSERSGFSSLVLPALTLGTSLAAILTRMTRNSVLDTIKQEYVKTAHSKGVHPWWVLVKHVLSNAARPIITIVGLQFGALLTGAVITEKIFDWPGLGTLMLNALGSRDYPLIQGCILVYACSYLLINALTDFLLIMMDPPQRERM